MKKNKLLLAILSMILLTNCGKNSSSPEFSVNDTSNLSLDPNVKVTFFQIKSEILAPNCLSCHSSAGTETNLKKWIVPGKPDSSSFFTSVENGSMPKNQRPLDTRALELIRNYISQMAPTVPTPPAPSGTNTGITYAQIKAAVLSPYRCLNCHGVGTEASLARWMNKSSPASSSFYTTIKNGSMPQGGSRVPTAAQAYVLQYIKDFAKR
jgi:mono/diheme cytochrome c family protein